MKGEECVTNGFRKSFPLLQTLLCTLGKVHTHTHTHTHTHYCAVKCVSAVSPGSSQGCGGTHTHTHTHTLLCSEVCVCSLTRIITGMWRYTHTHTHTHTLLCSEVCVCSLTRIITGMWRGTFGSSLSTYFHVLHSKKEITNIRIYNFIVLNRSF